MGALFNTKGTLVILKFLNNHYLRGANFNTARANAEYDVLRDFTAFPDSYSCAAQLALDDGSVTPRWKKWLKILDAHRQGFNFGGRLVRAMMADALDPSVDTNCNGIEFFAVPSSQFLVHYPAPAVKDPNNPNLYTREIVVETDTIDTMAAFFELQGQPLEDGEEGEGEREGGDESE